MPLANPARRTARRNARRTARRDAFLAAHGHDPADLQALPADASFRRYYRLPTALLMDSPPALEPVAPWLLVARHLRRLGLSAPAILAEDTEAGFVLIEDFGDATFTRLLAAGEDEAALYDLAVDALLHLHAQPGAAAIDVPAYDVPRLALETELVTEWYIPAATRRGRTAQLRADWIALWEAALGALPPQPETLILRDYHVDNLMRLPGRTGAAACGLLDFQDALRGSAAYDLVSLVEDARRDLSPGLPARLLARYRGGRGGDLPDGFDLWLKAMAAQRHARVLGVFVRLWLRDGKPRYLRHLPHTWRLLTRALTAPHLAPIGAFLAAHAPPPPDFDAADAAGLLAATGPLP